MTQELRIKELEKLLQAKNEEIARLNETISDCEKIQKALLEEVYQYKGLIYSSSSLIFLLKGENFVIEFANDPIKRIWGKGENVTGKPLFEVVPEVREQGIEGFLNKVYHKGEPFHAHAMPVSHNINGEMVTNYFDIAYMPQRDSKGNIHGVGVIAKNVTEQEKLHQEVKRNEKKFRDLVDFMPYKISLTDKNGRSFYYNKSWLDFTGYSLEEILEKRVRGMMHPDDAAMVTKEGERALAKNEPLEVECRFRNKEGDYKWHICKAIPLKDDGETITWITSCAEIQKIKEEEQRKEDFLKLVSHELKTPVTSIKGYVQLMQTIIDSKNQSSDSFKPYLGRIAAQVERLIRLISEILDLSRIEQNELDLKKEVFLLNDLINEVTEDISFTYRDIHLFVEHSEDYHVTGDRDRIGQVLTNFITNAMKYSENEKRIEIKVYENEDGMAAVAVKDFGIGISEKDKKLIFNRFFRVPGKNEDTYSGFGIGLYLSRQIVERHNGEIIVNSELGQGSEFIFTLPLNAN